MDKFTCPFGNTRCLCQDCTSNAYYEDCKKGYCIECLECIDNRMQKHDVYICTGHESRVKKDDTREEVEEARWKGAGMGDFRCSRCDTVVSGKPDVCPGCRSRMT